MGRPVTLFTGQWADLPLETLCRKAREFGYDGLELACWGDHFEVDKALSDDTYCARKRDLLEKHDLKLFAISNHLVGQAVLDRIVFGGIGRIVGDTNFQADAVGEGLEILLEEVLRRTVAAAAATVQQRSPNLPRPRPRAPRSRPGTPAC